MKEGFNTILSPLEQAWQFVKIDMNSNYFKKFGGISNMNQVRTLYDYYKLQDFREGAPKSSDLKDSDKTKNYFVITIDDPTGTSETGTIDLIVDSTGHDIAITYVGDDGVKFEISPNIIKNNAEMLKNLDFGVDMNPNDIARMIAPKDMDALVREIEKNSTVAMRSTQDAKNRADDYDRNLEDPRKVRVEAEERGNGDSERDAEIDEGLEQNKDIPQEMYNEITRICKENDLNPEDLKQTLTIVDPAELMDQMVDNSKSQVTEHGGEVTMLRFKNKEAGAGADKVFMVQGGKLLKHDEANDQVISDTMEDHKGTNVKVENFEDTRIDDLEVELAELKSAYEAEAAQISQNYDNVELTETFTEEKRDIKKEEELSKLSLEYEADVEEVCNRYMPPRTKSIEDKEQEAKDKPVVEKNSGYERTFGPSDRDAERRGLNG